jgi:hypothetical protein
MFTINEANKERIAEMVRSAAKGKQLDISVAVYRKVLNWELSATRREVYVRVMPAAEARTFVAGKIMGSVFDRVAGNDLTVVIHSMKGGIIWKEIAEATLSE